MLYMATFTINIPQMLAYIPYMDPMGMNTLNTSGLAQKHRRNLATWDPTIASLRSVSATRAPFSPWSLLEVWKSPAEGFAADHGIIPMAGFRESIEVSKLFEMFTIWL